MLLQFKLEDIIDSGLIDFEPPVVACECQINISAGTIPFEGGTISIEDSTFCDCETGESEFEATFAVGDTTTTATLVPGTALVNCETESPTVSFDVAVAEGPLEGRYTLVIEFDEENGEFTIVSPPGFPPIGTVDNIDFEIIDCTENGNGNGAG
ncbi:hypothetical protein RYX45_15985 [Alkalihalophilus pseudofirmus]|uniref:Uncharacterized protein n=1 Tax=Alkalihalophilus pseudofirmus TaxID=79885 RepID=A0AAJ2NQK6_ALKPS|nr:hypothetical protein [Alkalihalophilus pseudofirmus]MDV2886693.1 hypothetical protein [Alkalihalophilus pseudofirmus]